MNWGHGITIAIISFMGYILFLVYQTTKAEIDLVSNTYYEDELGYNERKLALERSLPYVSQLKCEVKSEVINYTLPALTSGVEGTITFRHPRNEEGDVRYSFDRETIAISRAKLEDEVPYNVVIIYNSGGEDYRIETKLILL